jgi:hypothetical protein
MTQSTQRATAPTLAAPVTLAQHRAIRFVSDRIAEADASQWHGGYIHGLIQALIMAESITVKQACELEQKQERASCDALSRRAVGGAA